MMTRSTHTTYLDTVGRPTVTFLYEQLTDKHMGTIYVGHLYNILGLALM